MVTSLACAPAAAPPATQAPTAATTAPAAKPTTPPTVAEAKPIVAGAGQASTATSAAPTTAAKPAGTTAAPATTPAATSAAAPAATTATKSAAATSIAVKGAYAQASTAQGAIFVAREKGFFKRHGLDVQLSQIGGVQQVAALISGDIQFAGMGANEVANADLRGSDLVMIATCSDLPIFSLFADKKYTSVPELAGQSIGITTAGSSTDAAAHLFLRHFGVLDKVKILPAGGSQPSILAAMDQGAIAGGILSPPTTSRAKESGYTELVNGRELGVPMNHSGIVVSRAYMKSNPEVVQNYIAGYMDAWTYAADPANKSDVVAILGQYTQSDERLATLGYEAIYPIWAANKTPRISTQAVINLLEVSGVPEAASAEPEKFFDNSVIDALTSR